MKGADEKVANREIRSMAERALNTLRKASEGVENKQVRHDAAVAIVKTALGDKYKEDELLRQQ